MKKLLIFFSLFFCFLITVTSDAFAACGDLQLLAENTTFANLRCDATTGYVVYDPKASNSLSGFEIQGERFRSKETSFSGLAFKLDRLKGKLPVKDKAGNTDIRFKCQQSETSNLVNTSITNKYDFAFSKLSGPSKELDYDTFEICPIKPFEKISFFRPEVIGHPAIFTRSATPETDGGFFNYLKFQPNEKSVQFQIFYGKDNSSSNNPIQLQIREYTKGNPEPIVTTSPTLTTVKSTVNAFDPNKYEVTPDFRLDPNNQISQRIRNIIAQVSSELESALKENSKTNYSGIWKSDSFYIPPVKSVSTTPGVFQYGITPFSQIDGNTSLPAQYNKRTSLKLNDFFEDSTFFFEPIVETRLANTGNSVTPTGLAFGSEFLFNKPGGVAGTNLIFDPTFYNNNAQLPFAARISIDSSLENYTDDQIKYAIRHEMLHGLGMINQFYPAFSNLYSDKTNTVGTQNFYQGTYGKQANSNQDVPMTSDDFHFADTVSGNLTDLLPGIPGLGNIPGPLNVGSEIKSIDKGVLADIGFCVSGVNDNPCN